MASPAASARSMRALRHAVRPVEGVVDGFADEEAHVGGDLLVAAAAGVELEGEVADLFGEFEFDVVVDVFGLWVGGTMASPCSACCLATARRPSFHLEEFFAGEDAGGFDGAGVGYAGFDFVGDEAPVEGEGALPGFEGGGRVVRGSGRTTFCWLLLGHCSLLQYSFCSECSVASV